ncbi:N-acetylneuraminate synthase family protein [Luminiphilus sp.]|nr:N-acetylneuraminate synthase family protein [Luminiphilus sp.]
MGKISQRDKNLFENLFVLELANNHNGDLEKGLKIVQDHGQICRQNNIKAAIKLQFRAIDTFVHADYKNNDKVDQKALNYIYKTEKKALTKEHYRRLVKKIKAMGCIPMSTPFDEDSVDFCVDFDFSIIKVASSDMNDWPLIEKIASTRRPVIVSSGGASEKDLDDLVSFFTKRNIPLCINHCVSLYPSEDHQLHLDQIDYLKNRYPDNIIGFSTHEYHDWTNSMMISYAKGARSWERHIDIDWNGESTAKYNSLPHQIDDWFKAYQKAREMCGGVSHERRKISKDETRYLDALVRGIYLRQDLDKGAIITKENFSKYFYLSVPLLKGQLSCREIFDGEILTTAIKKDKPLMIDNVNGVFAEHSTLRHNILNRGL